MIIGGLRTIFMAPGKYVFNLFWQRACAANFAIKLRTVLFED